MSELPAVRFLRALCAAVLRDEPPADAAARAHAALREVWGGQRSLVLEVQFTGFVAKGERLRGVDPAFLRAAGQLIVARINRLGFTPDADAADVAALFEILARPPAEIGADGIVGAVRTAAPSGIYIGTSTGQTYKPAPKDEAPAADSSPAGAAPAEPPVAAEAAAPAEPSVAMEAAAPADLTSPVAEPETTPVEAVTPGEMPSLEATAADEPPAPASIPSPAPWSSGVGVDQDDDADLSAFEFVEDVLDVATPPAASAPAAPAEGPRSEEPGANDMYHFFRASSSDRGDEESAALPGLLHATDNMSRYDDLAASCARNALRHLRAGDHLQAVDLLEALAVEAERTDRTRLYRESAAQALRSVGTSENLPHVIDLLQFVGNERERVLHVLFFLGGEAVTLLENHLFRTQDAEVRRAIFRRLQRGEGGGRPTVARALADSPVRARAILELVTIPEVDPEQSVRWTADAAANPEAAVRTDAARVAAQIGGRGGLRILVDLLSDADRGVRRAALHGLASMQDPASVPFITRFLNDNGDDDLQLAAVAALGRTGSADALPPLLAIVNKRSLFGGRKAKSLKLAAIEAIGLTGVSAARDVLASISSGSDSDLAAEARRTLASIS
ncbi:MAG TPA: HEAT repeat domain-containing protein [Longimicrobium sp.]